MRPIHWNPFIFRKETVMLLKKEVHIVTEISVANYFVVIFTVGNTGTVSNRKHVVPVNPVSWNKSPKKKAILPLLFILILRYQIQNWSPLLTILYSTIVSDFTEEKRLSRISSRRPPPPFWKETANRLEGEFTFLIALFFVVVRLGP